MIDWKKSAEMNGMSVVELKEWFDENHGSNKKVWRICDNCGDEMEVIWHAYSKLCHKCVHQLKEYRKIVSGIQSVAQNRPEVKTKMREVQLIAQNRPEVKAKRSKAQSVAQNRPEVKAKKAKTMKKTWKDPEVKAKRSGKNHWNWKGGRANDEYCSLFDEPLKVAVRNYFDNRCFLCGATIEGNGDKQMSVHHVGYQKNCGCDSMHLCIYSPLCNSCHTKTNGSKTKNRHWWYTYIMHKLFIEHPNYTLYHIPAFGTDQMYYNYEYVFKGNYKQRKSN